MTEPLDGIRTELASIKSMLNEVLHGDPATGRLGVYIRLDRLEQQARQLGWFVATAVTAALAAVISVFTSHK